MFSIIVAVLFAMKKMVVHVFIDVPNFAYQKSSIHKRRGCEPKLFSKKVET